MAYGLKASSCDPLILDLEFSVTTLRPESPDFIMFVNQLTSHVIDDEVCPSLVTCVGPGTAGHPSPSIT